MMRWRPVGVHVVLGRSSSWGLSSSPHDAQRSPSPIFRQMGVRWDAVTEDCPFGTHRLLLGGDHY